MTPKTNSKRVPLPRTSDHAKAFVRDWERLSRAGRVDLRRVREAMLLLIANGGPMPPAWLDHPLKGGWIGHRECHAGGDVLLIYRLQQTGRHELVVFSRVGTHAELFNE